MFKNIENLLKEKGIGNIELTKYKNKYHVLHICQNNMPVPLFISEDKGKFLDYIKVHYEIDVGSKKTPRKKKSKKH